MEAFMTSCDNEDNLSRYYKNQCSIQDGSRLYEEKKKHGSKILMLFAEVYPFLTKLYGIDNATDMILNYQNTNVFLEWFWRTKHRLGEVLQLDPNEFYIGEWIGKGFFLKITLSILIYNNIIIDTDIVNTLINKQKKMIEAITTTKIDNTNEHLLKNNNQYCIFPSINIRQSIDGYTLLDQVILYTTNIDLFFENVIYD